MPKVVDHVRRREAIAGALWRIVEREGMLGVSVRSIARELQSSPSSLRYYFATQTELLEFALTSMLDRVRARIEARLATFEPGLDLVAWLVEMFKEGMPLDDERSSEGDVWMALHAQSRFNPRLAEATRHEWTESQRLCRLAVMLLAGLPTDPDSSQELDRQYEIEATMLHAFWDGLTFGSASPKGEFSPAQIDMLMRMYLQQLGHRLASDHEVPLAKPDVHHT